MIKHLTATELHERLEDGESLLVLDVRESQEWEIGHIAGALHLPMSELPERVEELPRDVPIVCQCHHGIRSLSAAQYLESLGFEDLYNLSGGIDAWSCEVDPAVARY